MDYALHCRGCHLADGSGTPGAVPPLRGEMGRFVGVPRGREFLIRVPGAAQSALDDERLAAVLNWMLREFSAAELPVDFEPFSVDEVSRHRSRPLLDVAPLRLELVRALAAREAGGDPRPEAWQP